jgi:GGDEF domain-containing protein
VSAVRAIERVADQPGVTASGVAIWDGREPAAHLIRRADGALYEAKRSGATGRSWPPPQSAFSPQ